MEPRQFLSCGAAVAKGPGPGHDPCHAPQQSLQAAAAEALEQSGLWLFGSAGGRCV